MNRIYYSLFLIELNVLLAIVFLYAKLSKTKSNKKVKKILALPFYPLEYAGGHSRIANWKPYFEKNGVQFDVHWAAHTREFLNEYDKGSWLKKYLFYHKILWRRFFVIFRLKKYDCIWVQRGFIPFYPFKDAYFEKVLRKINDNFVLDYYDADYESNYNLTINSAKEAKRLTLASKYLVDFYDNLGINSFYVRYAMNFSEYHKKLPKANTNKIIIGWMGAPANFKNILNIEDQLIEIENEFPNVEFHFICRELPALRLKRFKKFKWGDKGFDYHKSIANFDIGIAPMINASERDKARTAFKTLEYMATALPFVTSPWGTSDKLLENQNCLYAHNKEEWVSKIRLLLVNQELCTKIGANARKTLEDYHSYDGVYSKLSKALTDWTET